MLRRLLTALCLLSHETKEAWTKSSTLLTCIVLGALNALAES